MRLSLGCVPNRAIDQEASSRIRPLETPLRKKGCILKRCVFNDDEAHVDEDSNNIEENTLTDDTEWLISSFVSATYLDTMEHFLVSIEDSRGDAMPVTMVDLEEWGPLRRKKNATFEKALGKEWQEIKGNKFLVWDGNHRLKTWWKRIKINIQIIHNTMLVFVVSSLRAHVTPNIAHEVYMFQKFGLANKESILERLTPNMREWAKVEMTMEARYYHGIAPWYNTPCGLISELVWKDEFNAFMSKESAKLDALGLNDVEKKKRLAKATKVEEECLKYRGYKYLSIANPLKDDESVFQVTAFLHIMDIVKSFDTSEKMPELVFSA
ncbi:hypothetical protein L7F22_068848, partial [Adiantum nelumboides]|nr:hypothetical protein [Adiantum nelumboides]